MDMISESTRHQEPTLTVIGIDEAGYGPLLGPLVVSATAFDVPVSLMKTVTDAAAGPDLWSILSKSITRRVAKRDARLAVCDSKKLYSGRSDICGLGLLEQTALAFAGQLMEAPRRLGDLLGFLCPEVVDAMATYPWYVDHDPALPIGCRAESLKVQVQSLQRDLSGTGIRLRGIWSEVLCAGHYNQRVMATRNKAVVLFGCVTRLMQRVSHAVGPEPLRIWVDRQGGRTHYRRALMTAFAEAQLEIIEESQDRSSYRMSHAHGPWMVRFVKNAETHHLPVALASIVSKYIRETMMTCFNSYWSQRVNSLKPTAGYYQDGQRFLADIAEAVEQIKIDRDQLVRRL
jgi:ribonuclease HII